MSCTPVRRRADQLADQRAAAFFGCQIHWRRRAFFAAQDVGEILRGAEMGAVATDHQNRVTFLRQMAGRRARSRPAAGRRRQWPGSAGSLRHGSRCRARHVAGNDREIEFAAGFADAFDAADELAHDLRLFRVAEIEVVGCRQRLGADGGQVAPDLGNGLLAAFERIGLAVARRDVDGEGKALAVPSTRITPASPPGVAAVLPWISVSYCS